MSQPKKIDWHSGDYKDDEFSVDVYNANPPYYVCIKTQTFHKHIDLITGEETL